MPKTPLCDRCPISPHCAAYAQGDPASFPRKTRKAERPRRFGAAYVVVRNGEVALLRRPPKGLLGGMLALPSTEWTATPPSDLQVFTGVPVTADWVVAGEIDHVFTHFALTLQVLRAETTHSIETAVWTPLDQASDGLPSVFLKALRVGLNGLL